MKAKCHGAKIEKNGHQVPETLYGGFFCNCWRIHQILYSAPPIYLHPWNQNGFFAQLGKKLDFYAKHIFL